MAHITLHKTYKCSDDCVPEGCPSHNIDLSFQSVSNAYLIHRASKEILYFEQGEMQAIFDLLKEISTLRADAIK